MVNESDQAAWTGFAKGEAKLWRKFLSQIIPQLYNMFIKRWPNPSLAEELTQKTVFDAVRGRESYDPIKGSPEEWIHGIARNNIRLEIRRRASRPSINGDLNTYLEAIDNKPLPDEVLERKETVSAVRAAMGQLAIKEKQALKGKYIEHLSANQIAAQMGVSEKAVHSLLYRARVHFRERIQQIMTDIRDPGYES